MDTQTIISQIKNEDLENKWMEYILYSVRILFLILRIMFLVSNRKLNDNKEKRVQIRRSCVLCCEAFIILGAERTPLYKKD